MKVRKKETKSKRVLISWNGHQYNIAGAIEEYLVSMKYEVVSTAYPLIKLHRRIAFRKKTSGSSEKQIKLRTIFKPPISFLIDPIYNLFPLRAYLAISFSSHLTPGYLLARKLGLVDHVIHWNIDYSPRRFKNNFLNTFYRKLDKLSFEKADFQIDLTQKALMARSASLNIPITSRNVVVPVGIWGNHIESISDENFSNQNIVFLGNIESRLGIDIVIQSMEIIIKKFPNANLTIIGDGNYRTQAEQLSKKSEAVDSIRWVGNQNESGIREYLMSSTLATAPYIKDSMSFSNYADPSKIKHYLTYSLPIVMTDVPPISQELFLKQAAIEAKDEAKDFALKIETILGSYELWKSMRDASLEVAHSYKWENLLPKLFSKF